MRERQQELYKYMLEEHSIPLLSEEMDVIEEIVLRNREQSERGQRETQIRPIIRHI